MRFDMKCRTKRVCLILGIVASLMPGCTIAFPGCDYSFVDTCVVDPTLIVVDDAASPSVPDQIVTGCISVSIVRTVANEVEREMVRKAEALASTIGTTWFGGTSSTVINGDQFLVADAVTSEALSYYAKRALSFQTSTTPENPRIYLTYSARLLGEPRGALYFYNGALYGPTVRLELGYGEGYNQIAGAGFTAWREVVFDQAGEVAQIRGDGETFMPVARVVNSD